MCPLFWRRRKKDEVWINSCKCGSLFFQNVSLQSEEGTAETFGWSLVVFGSEEEIYLFVSLTLLLLFVLTECNSIECNIPESYLKVESCQLQNYKTSATL